MLKLDLKGISEDVLIGYRVIFNELHKIHSITNALILVLQGKLTQRERDFEFNLTTDQKSILEAFFSPSPHCKTFSGRWFDAFSLWRAAKYMYGSSATSRNFPGNTTKQKRERAWIVNRLKTLEGYGLVKSMVVARGQLQRSKFIKKTGGRERIYSLSYKGLLLNYIMKLRRVKNIREPAQLNWDLRTIINDIERHELL